MDACTSWRLERARAAGEKRVVLDVCVENIKGARRYEFDLERMEQQFMSVQPNKRAVGQRKRSIFRFDVGADDWPERSHVFAGGDQT